MGWEGEGPGREAVSTNIDVLGHSTHSLCVSSHMYPHVEYTHVLVSTVVNATPRCATTHSLLCSPCGRYRDAEACVTEQEKQYHDEVTRLLTARASPGRISTYVDEDNYDSRHEVGWIT